jgi:ZIP family zinc transporter
MSSSNVLLAFGLTLFAGISTGIGSLMAFFLKKTNTKLLSMILGFSAGVMIYISMVELFQEAKSILTIEFGMVSGMWITLGGFFAGMLIIAIIDKLIPSSENPHEIHKIEEIKTNCSEVKSSNTQKLMKMGILTSIAIAVHNFPEGIAAFIAAFKDPNVGVAIAVAIAIHNIPEGIAVSVPIYYATGSKKKALVYSFMSGLSEPLGAILTYLFLMPIMNDTILGILLSMVAGIMIFISLDELLPMAREYGESHLSTYGLVLGMAVIAASLMMFS